MINFEKIIYLGTYEKPSLSSDRRKDFTDLWLYGIKDEFAENSKSIIKNGDYSNPSFLPMATKISSNKVADIRVKSLPGFGAYGYYTLKNPNTTYLQIPFHLNTPEEDEPAIALLYEEGTLTVTVLAASSYDCFRVRITKGAYTQDKIAYVRSSKAEIKVNTGAVPPFDVTVVGYKNEIAAVSVPAVATLYTDVPAYVSATGRLLESGTSLTHSISATVGNYLIAFVTTAYPFSSSTGWAYRYSSEGYLSRKTTVLLKQAVDTTESLTIDTDTASGPIGITLVEVSNLHDIDCVDRDTPYYMFSSYTVRRKSAPCIYFMSSRYYNAINANFDPLITDPPYNPITAPVTIRVEPDTSIVALQNRLQQLVIDNSTADSHSIITTGCNGHEVLTFSLT